MNWTKHTAILDTAEVKWAKIAMWAPSVINKDGKYYLFFGANDVHEGEIGGIGVAVSDRPEGPYKDLLGKPLINEIVNGASRSISLFSTTLTMMSIICITVVGSTATWYA